MQRVLVNFHKLIFRIMFSDAMMFLFNFVPRVTNIVRNFHSVIFVSYCGYFSGILSALGHSLERLTYANRMLIYPTVIDTHLQHSLILMKLITDTFKQNV